MLALKQDGKSYQFLYISEGRVWLPAFQPSRSKAYSIDMGVNLLGWKPEQVEPLVSSPSRLGMPQSASRA